MQWPAFWTSRASTLGDGGKHQGGEIIHLLGIGDPEVIELGLSRDLERAPWPVQATGRSRSIHHC